MFYSSRGPLRWGARRSPACQVPIVFAGLLVLAILGILLYTMTVIIEKRFTGWAFRGQSNR